MEITIHAAVYEGTSCGHCGGKIRGVLTVSEELGKIEGVSQGDRCVACVEAFGDHQRIGLRSDGRQCPSDENCLQSWTPGCKP